MENIYHTFIKPEILYIEHSAAIQDKNKYPNLEIKVSAAVKKTTAKLMKTTSANLRYSSEGDLGWFVTAPCPLNSESISTSGATKLFRILYVFLMPLAGLSCGPRRGVVVSP